MTKVRLIIFLFTSSLLTGLNSHGQTSCDSISSDLVQQFDGYSQKQFKKLVKKKNLDLSTVFKIATYLRQKGDTAYKQWYSHFVDAIKNFHSKEVRKLMRTEECVVFKLGQAYYFLDDFEQANTWFIKATKAQCNNTCLSYYNLKTEQYLKIKNASPTKE